MMLKKLLAAAVVGVFVCITMATPVSAEEIVDVVQRAKEDTFEIDFPVAGVVESDGGGFEATTEVGEVNFPEKSDEPIEIETVGGILGIKFPGTEKEQGNLVGDSVAYPDVGEGLGVVVDATEDGVGVSTVIATPEAPHVIDYDFLVPDNGYLQLEDEGSVSVRNGDGEVLNWIAQPWATDANGEPVQTWYTVEKNVLTQHVKSTPSTVYPVTADPYTCGWRGCYFVLSKAATKDIATTGPAGALICGAIGAYTGGIGIAACAVSYVPYFVQATRAYNRGECLAVPIAGSGVRVEGGSSCR